MSCDSNNKNLEGEVITVSIRPQKYILEQIAGDRFKINVLVPDGSGPETYEPSARQMQELRNSQAYLTMGLMDFEKNWIPKLNDLYPDLDVVNVSEGIIFLVGDHHHHHDAETSENSDKEKHDQDHLIPEAKDPHIWLSLKTVKVQSSNILKYLSAKFPSDKNEFIANHDRFIARLDSLDKSLVDLFSQSSDSLSFIIYHPSLSYFANDYGILQIPIELEGKEPSPTYLKELIDIAKERKLTTIFYSEQFDKKSAQTLASQLGISLTPFNPLAENIEDNLLSVSKKIIQSKTR